MIIDRIKYKLLELNRDVRSLHGIAGKLICLAILLTCCLSASAETVSQKQAMKLAQQFFNQAYKEIAAPVKLVYNGKRLTTDRLFTPFYVYNEPRGGFVIISAEDKTFPILGYSLKESFDPNSLTESQKGWLESYAHDIELIRYDSRVPEDAIKAWQDFPGYVINLLKSPYESFSASLTLDEAAAGLDNLLSMNPDDTSRDGEYSAFYTPAQWQEMIDSELNKNKEVAIGYVDMRKHLHPGVIYGKKGDYYSILLDNPDSWMLRIMPSEFLGERLVALLGEPKYIAPEEDEDLPFEFYDSYRNSFIAEAFPSTNSIEESRMELMESSPIVKSIGGGHFDIIMPSAPRLAMLYNLNGSHIGRFTYGGTSNVAHINIEGEPQGFYIAVIIDDSGKAYGVKLYR